MTPAHANLWQQNGARVAAEAQAPEAFIEDHISPLLFRRTADTQPVRDCTDIPSEMEFWRESSKLILGLVRLRGFKLTDWFPRAPGVYWSENARRARAYVLSDGLKFDSELGRYFEPECKLHLIEVGGIGTIRLRPRRIDDEDCWLATALTMSGCHGGVPLAIPDAVLRESAVNWGDHVNLQGRVRFLQDAGLHDTAASVHHARPLIVFVDELNGTVPREAREPIVITPVALFEAENTNRRARRSWTGYTFVRCAAGSDKEIDDAADWIEKYTKKHGGRVITNFDEQRPVLADAPLSYQRLVAKTYDRTVIEHLHFNGSKLADRIDLDVKEVQHMGHKISVGGSAIINIDAVLTHVTQTIGSAPGLDSAQKSQLETLVQSLKADLDKLKASHADETKEIAEALEKAVASAAKPPQERKQSLLQLSAKGLKEAAALVKDIAPSVLATADLIAKFIVGL